MTARGTNKRLAREWKTITLMVRIFCRDHHGNALCPDCSEFLEYASTRLDRCRFAPNKPTCAKCPVHCYQMTRREHVRQIMRYAGPRMILEHPVLSLRHWLDGWSARPRLAEREGNCRFPLQTDGAGDAIRNRHVVARS